MDAPVNHVLEKKNTSRSIKSVDSDKKKAADESFQIPAIKSPAQVAAEKAAEWKR